MVIGALVGLIISLAAHNPAYFATGLSLGIAVGYTLDKQSENKR